MGFQSLGTSSANWDSKLAAMWDVGEVEKGKGVVIYVRSVPQSTVFKQQYLNIIPVFDTDEGFIEGPLLAKFFPKGNWMGMSIGVPDFDYFDGAELTVIGFPQEFYPQIGAVRSQLFELAWEDSETLDSKSVAPFSGI